MKLALIPLLFLSACATQPAKKVVLVNPPGQSLANTNGLRTAEEIRAYRLGRYADPGDRTVMHEAHPVYRVEKSAVWNLRPKDVAGSDPAVSKAATAIERDALIAEFNRQKAVTKTLTEQTAALIQQTTSLGNTLGHTQKIAESIQALKTGLETLQYRISANEARTNAPAKPTSETNW